MQLVDLVLYKKRCNLKAISQALIAFQLLGTVFDVRDFCALDAVDEELCIRLFVGGWGVVYWLVVGACIFHGLTKSAVHARLVSKTYRASLVSAVDYDGDRVCLHDQCQTLEWWLTTA